MNEIPNCPKCESEYSYSDGVSYHCPDCAHEWSLHGEEESSDARVVKDASGNVLENGDTVSLIKDLKVKGSSITLKVGTKIKGIRIVDGDHEIDCKVDGVSFLLKACFMRKAS